MAKHQGHDPNERKVQIDEWTFAYISPDGCINFHEFNEAQDIDDCVHICGRHWQQVKDAIDKLLAHAARG